VKKKIVVDISDAKVSGNPESVLVTYSLGSCIGVALFDAVAHVGGMLHYQLPDSKMDAAKAERQPFMFADTGMAILVKKLISMGAGAKRLQVRVAGGAAMANGPQGFDIGKRNYLAIRKVLWKHGLFIDGEDVGGNAPRNMSLFMSDGTVTIRSVGMEKKL